MSSPNRDGEMFVFRLIVASVLVASLVSILTASPPSLFRVERVIDGDTVVLDEVGTVRLVGVDTPETKHPTKGVQCYGPEASAFMAGLLYDRRVMVSDYNLKDKKDKYGRRLLYLSYGDRGKDVGEVLLREGYARVPRKETGEPYDHPKLELYLVVEREAQGLKKGLWGKCQEEEVQ